MLYLFVSGTDRNVFVGNHFGLGFDKGKDRGQVSGRQDHKKVAGSFLLHKLKLIV